MTAIRMAAALAALVLATGCSRDVTVKIGVVAPMTGPLAGIGKDIANGAKVAVEELNSDHFMIEGNRARFELVIEDDQASPEEGKLAAQRLVGQNVAAVFGHLNSGVTIAAAPIYAEAGIPQLSVSTNPKYTRMGLPTAFRITADDTQQGAALGRVISVRLRAKSVYAVDDKTLFGVGVTDIVEKTVKENNVALVRESVVPAATDYEALAKKIVADKHDVVFFGGDEATGLPLIKALRANGFTGRIAAPDAMCDVGVVKRAGGAADNNFYCSIAGVPPSWLSSGIGFTELYKQKFGTPGAYSVLSYDGIHVLAQAMQEAGSAEPAEYLPIMTKVSFSGKIQGSIEFDQRGDVKDGTVVIYQSIGGQLLEQRGML